MMDCSPKLDRESLKAKLLSEFEATIEAVADSIDTARDGRWIDDSEEASRVALDRLKQKVYEASLQAKADAAEAASNSTKRWYTISALVVENHSTVISDGNSRSNRLRASRFIIRFKPKIRFGVSSPVDKQKPATRHVRVIGTAPVDCLAVVDESVAGFESSAEFILTHMRRHLLQPHRISCDPARKMGQHAAVVAALQVIDGSILKSGGIHRNPDGQHIWRSLAKIGVVLMRRHARTDLRRFAKRLDCHQYRFSVNQCTDETADVGTLRQGHEVRIVRLHSPKVPDRSTVRFECAIADRNARNDVSDITVQGAAHLVQEIWLKEAAHADATIAMVLYREFVNIDHLVSRQFYERVCHKPSWTLCKIARLTRSVAVPSSKVHGVES